MARQAPGSAAVPGRRPRRGPGSRPASRRAPCPTRTRRPRGHVGPATTDESGGLNIRRVGLALDDPPRRPPSGHRTAPCSPDAGNYGTTSPSTTRPTWHSPKRWTPPCSPATADSPGHQDPAPHRDPPAHTLTPARVARPTAKRGCPGRRRARIRPIQTPERPPERDRAAWAARRSS